MMAPTMKVPQRITIDGEEGRDWEVVGIDTVAEHPENARVGDRPRLLRSLRDHGQYRALTANRRTNFLVAGNNVHAAMKAAGWQAFAVTWVDVDPATERAILLVDNRTQDLSTQDVAMLAEILQGMDEDGQLRAGYLPLEVENILAAAAADEALATSVADRMGTRGTPPPADTAPPPAPTPFPDSEGDHQDFAALEDLREVVVRIPGDQWPLASEHLQALRERYEVQGVWPVIMQALRREYEEVRDAGDH